MKESDSLLGSPPEVGTDQTSLPSPYSTLVPVEIKRPAAPLTVKSLVSGATPSTCGTSTGHRPVARTVTIMTAPNASHQRAWRWGVVLAIGSTTDRLPLVPGIGSHAGLRFRCRGGDWPNLLRPR